jgi:hypothetical protein
MKMNKICESCGQHRKDSKELRTGRKVIAGNYCALHHWNLDRVKPWTEKTSRCQICGKKLDRIQLNMHYPAVHGIKAPSNSRMNTVGCGCHE